MSTKEIHVLLVEDAVIAQIAQTNVLEDLGCRVTLASTGKEAIAKTLQAQHYDLIFLDLGLPDVDALTVTENILANYKCLQKTPPPIIALTAHAHENFHQQCLQAGMSTFLAKPLTAELARTLLEKY